MTTNYRDTSSFSAALFNSISLINCNSAVGTGAAQTWTVTNYTETTSISGTQSSAASIAAVVATLVTKLSAKGLI